MTSNCSALQPHAAIKQRPNRKRWVIVTFPEGNDYSVIPTNWVLKSVDGLGNQVIKCLWPPFLNVTSDIIQNAMEPSDNWSTHTIKLQENGKEYSCFNKAWHKQVEMSEESSSTEQSKRRKINEEASDSDSGEEIDILPVKTWDRPQETFIKEATNKPHYAELNNFNISQSSTTQNVLLNTSISHSFNKPEGRILSSVIQSDSSFQDELISVPNYLNPTNNVETIQSELIQTNEQNKMMGLLNLIYKEQIQNRVLYNQLLSKVNNIETIINKIGLSNNISTATHNFDENFLLNWPIINEQTFKHVENSLLDNLFVQQVEEFFNSIGGNSVKDNLKRILIKTFSNEFAIRCSWTGRGKDITTKLCDAKLVTVLKRCIRRNQQEYSDALFESVFADWFRYATTRHRRSLETNH
ncbi:uncharacterized protein LOC126841625 [Adelges cooleyi]|uniref:uncharacterized protein LOC126841625 n=1 Tax=Adelges cooleyi TaxID=133065 RepID=UPI0021809AB8|nr:uncharacterized protein LOC126841625 [Adelges cooleyi]